MEERKITERESLSIISEMIEATKQMANPQGLNYMLLWGWTSVLTTIAVFVALQLTANPWWNLLFLAIPVIGKSGEAMSKRSQKRAEHVVTYVSRSIASLWKAFTAVWVVAVVGCGIAQVAGVNVWIVLFLMALPMVGTGIIATGAILRMKSFLVGGSLTCLFGAVLIAMMLVTGQFSTLMLLVFAAGFFTAFVIPGYGINRK